MEFEKLIKKAVQPDFEAVHNSIAALAKLVQEIQIPQQDRLIDKKELGEILKLKDAAAMRTMKNAGFEPIYVGGRKGAVRFRLSDVMTLVNKGKK